MVSATVSAKPSATSCTGDTLSRRTASSPMPAGAPHAELGARGPHHPAAQFACQIDGFGDADERVRKQQATGGVLPAHQRLGRQHLAGAHVDLGQVVQHQRAAVDDALQMKLDVVAERALHRHVIGEHRDLVAAGALWRSAPPDRPCGADPRWCHGPGSPSATPTLTVRVSISPSMATRSRSAFWRVAGKFLGVDRRPSSVAGTTTNSSPPRRAIRQRRRSSRADVRRTPG